MAKPMSFIDLQSQQERIRPQLEAAIRGVLDHGQYIMGPEVAELERRLAEFVGVRHAIACSSGTDALLLALMALGIGPGDAVFTSPFTFFATCETIVLVGATPIFVDIDPATFNIDPVKLGQVVEASAQAYLKGSGPAPKAIMPVDLFGLPADYPAIRPVAERYGLVIVEDGAQAFGAACGDRRAPGLGHIGTTSFFPAKPLGCYGDGGAVFTDDEALAEVVRSLVVHGKGEDKYNNARIGLNARMDTLQAAILLEKLNIYEEELELRDKVARSYTEGILQADGIERGLAPPSIPDGYRSAWAQYTLTCKHRDELRRRLDAAGVPSMVYYVKPLHLLDALAFLGYRKGDFPFAEEASQRVLSLPMHPYLDLESINHVVAALGDDG